MMDLRMFFEGRCNMRMIHQLLEGNRIDFEHLVDENDGYSDEIYDLLVDCALFGKPACCPQCPNGQVSYSVSEQTYKCLGYVSEYTKCTYQHKNPLRSPFIIPQEIMNYGQNQYLKFLKVNQLFGSQRVYYDEDRKQPCTSSESPACPQGSLSSIDKPADDQKSLPSGKSRQVIKNGTVLDGEFRHVDKYHAYKDENGELYMATLSWTDIVNNTNSFYKISLYEPDSVNYDEEQEFILFTSWGRVGTTVQTKEEYYDKMFGTYNFHSIFLEKTGNHWRDRKYFIKKAGRYSLVETDYSEFKNVATDTDVVVPGSRTKLHRSIKEVIMMIFDVENMKNAMRQFELDLDRMPVGKLSKKQIMAAFSVLKDLEQVLTNPGRDELCISDCTNRFYTLIPHNFGMKSPVLLDSLEMIKSKSAMLESLLEIELAYSVINGSDGTPGRAGEDPVDLHYWKLNCNMEYVDPLSQEFKNVETYLINSHGHTHNNFTLKLIDLIRVERKGEKERFKRELGNRMLLWHGSRLSNYGGILSQGLRIAPEEAPSTGFMFGKGIYFADMVSKSANYCRVQRYGDHALLLLCDVALGVMQRAKHAFKNQDSVKPGCHSVKGQGMNIPAPTGHFRDMEGSTIPLGKPVLRSKTAVHKKDFSLLYNEYIVYNPDQVNLRYLVRVSMGQKEQ